MLVKMRCYKLYCLHVHDWVDGQKIAKKLSVQITKEGRNIRGLLEKYSVVSAGDRSQALTLQEALDPELVESRLQAKGSYTAIASGERRVIIDSYLMLCRSREEMSLLKLEAQNVVTYYEDMEQALEEELGRRSADVTDYNRGAISLCHGHLKRVKVLLAQGKEVLNVMYVHGGELEVETESMLNELDRDSDADNIESDCSEGEDW